MHLQQGRKHGCVVGRVDLNGHLTACKHRSWVYTNKLHNFGVDIGSEGRINSCGFEPTNILSCCADIEIQIRRIVAEHRYGKLLSGLTINRYML